VIEVVVEVEQPVLDRDASLAGLVGEVEVDRRAGPREPKLILDHRILPRVRVGLRAADVEIRRRGRDREREERRLGLSDRAVRGRAAAQVGLGQVVLQPQGAVSLAGGEPEHGRVLLRELDRTRGGERAQPKHQCPDRRPEPRERASPSLSWLSAEKRNRAPVQSWPRANRKRLELGAFRLLPCLDGSSPNKKMRKERKFRLTVRDRLGTVRGVSVPNPKGGC